MPTWKRKSKCPSGVTTSRPWIITICSSPASATGCILVTLQDGQIHTVRDTVLQILGFQMGSYQLKVQVGPNDPWIFNPDQAKRPHLYSFSFNNNKESNLLQAWQVSEWLFWLKNATKCWAFFSKTKRCDFIHRFLISCTFLIFQFISVVPSPYITNVHMDIASRLQKLQSWCKSVYRYFVIFSLVLSMCKTVCVHQSNTTQQNSWPYIEGRENINWRN